jgi:hypothetical protein
MSKKKKLWAAVRAAGYSVIFAVAFVVGAIEALFRRPRR